MSVHQNDLSTGIFFFFFFFFFEDLLKLNNKIQYKQVSKEDEFWISITGGT